MTAGLWLVTGAQAAGKSTVADLLARSFDRAAHVRGGQFYRWAVRGWVHHDDPDDPAEGRRMLSLRYRLSALVADEYAQAGIVAVVNDNIYGEDVVRWIDTVRSRPIHLVVLRPAVHVVEARDRERTERTGKVAYRGGFTPAANDAAVAETPERLGLWLDTSHQTPQMTVAEILANVDRARVEP